jgi:SAM-dependent methyltransferase
MHNRSYYNDLLIKKQKNKGVDAEYFWDSRAENYSKMQNKQREGMPPKVIEHLIRNKLIDKKTKVLDIGGGSGRYAIPLAQVADRVVLTDISAKMLEYAEANAKKEGLDNLEYVKLDLDKANIREMGWNEKFDLVFASMCPAIRNEQALDKMMEASKGSCYIGQYIAMTDNIIEAIMGELDLSRRDDPHNDRDSVYAIFNILWLKGYEPEISYIREETEEEIAFEELKKMYGDKYAPIAKERNKDLDKIFLSLGDHLILKRKRTLALIWWKVR